MTRAPRRSWGNLERRLWRLERGVAEIREQLLEIISAVQVRELDARVKRKRLARPDPLP